MAVLPSYNLGKSLHLCILLTRFLAKQILIELRKFKQERNDLKLGGHANMDKGNIPEKIGQKCAKEMSRPRVMDMTRCQVIVPHHQHFQLCSVAHMNKGNNSEKIGLEMC